MNVSSISDAPATDEQHSEKWSVKDCSLPGGTEDSSQGPVDYILRCKDALGVSRGHATHQQALKQGSVIFADMLAACGSESGSSNGNSSEDSLPSLFLEEESDVVYVLVCSMYQNGVNLNKYLRHKNAAESETYESYSR